ncbi:hypothetical protein V6N11_043265 [Hibiscus sabdariffa]|uniref:Uncharacterized protein n=1 Tax=Hibiscus sabdariffa TaxID=183260 RepID=A0ABR2QYS4_9ROSI
MSLTANLLGPPSSFDLVIPGGRPPDIILVIPEGIVRERSVSPTSFGDASSGEGGRVRFEAPLSANPITGMRFASLRLEDMDDEQVQDGNRVNLVHEGEVAAPRIGNDEFAKQGLPHTVSKNATHKLSNPDRKGRAAKKRKKFIVCFPVSLLEDNISNFVDRVGVWNKATFGHIGDKKRRLQARLHGIDRTLMRYQSVSLKRLASKLKLDL